MFNKMKRNCQHAPIQIFHFLLRLKKYYFCTMYHSPEAAHGIDPKEAEFAFFGIKDIKEIEERQDKNLDTLSDLLKDRKQARTEGVRLIPSDDLQESQRVFNQLHHQYTAKLQAVMTALEHNPSSILLTAKQYKEADKQLQAAFE